MAALAERSSVALELVNRIRAARILKTKDTEIYTGVYGKRRLLAGYKSIITPLIS